MVSSMNYTQVFIKKALHFLPYLSDKNEICVSMNANFGIYLPFSMKFTLFNGIAMFLKS